MNDNSARNILGNILRIFIKIAKHGLANPYTLAILGLSFTLIIIPFVLISTFPLGDLFQNTDDVYSVEKKIFSGIKEAYINEIKESKRDIRDFVNEKYNAGSLLSDITYHDESFTIDTDTALITVSFTPNLDGMYKNISSYINAVNGVISFMGEDIVNEEKAYTNGTHEKIDTFDGRIFTENEKNEKVFTSDALDFYYSHSNELTNIKDKEYVKNVINSSNDFFVYDEKVDRWDLINFHISPKTHYIETINNETGEVTITKVTVPAWYGHIVINMYYDLSKFKEDELTKCYEIFDENNSVPGYDGVTVVSNLLNSYYENYISHFNGYYENNSFFRGKDNREEIFEKLLNDGTLMYIPISGLTSNFLNGEKGYSGEVNLNTYDNLSRMEVWNHVKYLRDTGKVSTRTYMWNCTAFAASWFYDLYGVDMLYGNGRDMVKNLLKSKWGSKHFYLGSSPAPGGIYSIGSPTGGNHVGCVDKVDYENKIITISDGNTNGKGDSSSTVRIKKEMTFSEFESYVKACCLGYGSANGAWVTFANPIEDSFT